MSFRTNIGTVDALVTTQSTMNTAIAQIRNERSLTPTTPCLNGLVIYEDAQTRDWAASALTRVAPSAAGALKTTWWRLDDLSSPGVVAGAVSSALRANIIVVAVRTGGNFPLPFYVWASSAMPHRAVVGGTLFGLIGASGEERARDYLSALGRQCGMRVLLEEKRLEPSIPESRSELSHFAVQKTASRTNWPAEMEKSRG